MEAFPTDHLPALIRKTGWQFRGDFFDPEIPLPVELHFQFWNEQTGAAARARARRSFGRRRIHRPMAGTEIAMLHPADALAYASLHLLQHLLRGSGKPFHGVRNRAACSTGSLAGTSVLARVARAASARIAPAGGSSFPAGARVVRRPRVAGRARGDRAACRRPRRAGSRNSRNRPLTREFSPNKDELWLHISLLESRRDAWSVARRRLLPGNLPPFAETAYLPKSQITWRHRMRKWRGGRHTPQGDCGITRSRCRGRRISGLRWWWRTNSLGEQFWIFLAAAVLFNFALFIFVLLYNLFLMDMGFREDFLGVVNGACAAGKRGGHAAGRLGGVPLRIAPGAGRSDRGTSR